MPIMWTVFRQIIHLQLYSVCNHYLSLYISYINCISRIYCPLGSHYEYDAVKIKAAYGGVIDQLLGEFCLSIILISSNYINTMVSVVCFLVLKILSLVNPHLLLGFRRKRLNPFYIDPTYFVSFSPDRFIVSNAVVTGPGEKMGGETHGVGWGQRNYHPGE